MSAREVRVEVLLHGSAVDSAAAVIQAPADDEQRMDPAVAGSAGSELEPRLTDGSIRCDEGGNDVTRAGGGCHGDLRVHRRRGSSGGGEAVAAAAAVEV